MTEETQHVGTQSQVDMVTFVWYRGEEESVYFFLHLPVRKSCCAETGEEGSGSWIK